jgi:hypothetical protein
MDTYGPAFCRAAPGWAVEQVADIRIRAHSGGVDSPGITKPAMRRAKAACEWVARPAWLLWRFGLPAQEGEDWQRNDRGHLP